MTVIAPPRRQARVPDAPMIDGLTPYQNAVADLAAPLIREFEGLRLRAYQCSAGVWTIGYGHTGDVQMGDQITEERAEQLLRHDMQWAIETAERISEMAPQPLTTAQIAALTSWIFNVGSTAALKSQAVTGRIKAGDTDGAARGLLLWVKAGGRKLAGLVRRREAERQLFLSEDVRAKEPEDAGRLTPDKPEPHPAGNTTVPATGVGIAGLLVMIAEYVQGVTGVSPELQKYVLLVGALTGVGGLVWAGWERIRKNRTGAEVL